MRSPVEVKTEGEMQRAGVLLYSSNFFDVCFHCLSGLEEIPFGPSPQSPPSLQIASTLCEYTPEE